MPETDSIVPRPLEDCKTDPHPGDVIDISYPFVRTTFTEHDQDGSAEVPCWAPGVRFEDSGHGDYVHTHTYADGIGQQQITVAGRFKPGKFPERVFFTRKWRDPSGHLFGKGKLHIKTLGAFRSIVSGYRYKFELSETSNA